MASPPHLSSNIQSLLHQILQSQQTFQHNLSVFATEVSYLTSRITLPCFTHTSDAIPQISHISFPQHPALIISTNLSPHSHHLHSQDRIPPLEPTLNNDSVPRYFQPTEKGEGEEKIGKFHEFIADRSNFNPIVADNFSITAEEDPHHSTFNPHPLPKEENGTSTVMPEPWICNIFPTEIRSPKPIHHAVFTKRFTGSRFFDYFILLTPDLAHSSCFDFELYARPATVPSPEKMMVNTTSAALPQRVSFVFYPGRILTVTVRSVRRNHHKFQKTVARTITLAAPPPQSSTIVFDPSGYCHRSRLHFLLTLAYFAQHHIYELCPRLFLQLSPAVAVAPPYFASFSVGFLLVITQSNWRLETRLGLGNVDGSLGFKFQMDSANGLLPWASLIYLFFTLGHWTVFVLSDLHGPQLLQFYFVGLNLFIFRGFGRQHTLRTRCFCKTN